MTVRILIGDVRARLRDLPDESVHCVVTSPPYWGLRNYSAEGQIGLEPTFEEYIAAMVVVFRDVRRVLRRDGVIFLNIGDAYAGSWGAQGRNGGTVPGLSGNQIKAAPQFGSRTGARAVDRHERAYGTSGKERSGSRRNDQISGNLCDACREALTVAHSPRIVRSPDAAPPLWPSSSSPEHMESSLGRLPTSSSSARAIRNEGANPDRPLGLGREFERPPASPVSMTRLSAPPRPGGCSRCDNCGACLAVLGSSLRDARACACRTAGLSALRSSWPSIPGQGGSSGDSALTAGASAVRTQGTASGCGAWRNDTTTYRHIKPKDLLGMAWAVAFALRADGWWLRSDIIWAKPNPMPESVTDRPTSAHEHLFLLAKSERYFFDAAAVREASQWDPANTKAPDGWDTGAGAHGSIHRNGRKNGARLRGTPPRHAKYESSDQSGLDEVGRGAGRNMRSVWTIATAPFPEAHFATFPPALVEPCIKAGTSERGVCSNCGAPWVRKVDVQYDNPGNRSTNGPRSVERRHETAGFEQRLEKRTTTTGWSSSCKCNAAVVPATVLDPFCGAATTLMVADRLGRDAIGIELNRDYVEMARRRLENDGGMFSRVEISENLPAGPADAAPSTPDTPAGA